MSIQTLLACCAAVAMMSAAHAEAPHRFTDEDRQAVEAVFIRQAEAATAHDIDAFAGVLASAPAGEPDPVVLLARSYQFWGKPALIEHFKDTFKGVWKFEPDVAKIRVAPLSADAAQLYAPTRVTAGASEATAKTASFLVYETAVRTADGWRIASIVPVPAQ